MTTLTTLAGQPFAQALAWALLHFLWQGAILALGAMALFRVFRDSARARYAVGIVTLAAMLAAPVATTMWIVARRDVAIVMTPASAAEASVAPASSVLRLTKTVPVAAPIAPTVSLTTLVLLLWMIGVVALSVRLLGGWVTARRVARRVIQPAAPEVQAMVSRLAAQLNLRRIVRVVESASVRVPIMIGWLKPVVILPTAVASGFTPAQVEALIVHELAHVRRHDYLVNLLQTMVETALFYHPAVWWVSKRVRTERELCCDDVAVTICDRLVYARALSDLAEIAAPHLAMAASNGSLVDRVRRILGRPSEESTSGAGWVPVFVILTLVAPVLSAPKPQSAATAATTATQAPTASAAVTPTTVSSAAPTTATADHLPAASSAIAASSAPAVAAPAQATTSTAIVAKSGQDQRDLEIEQLRARLQELENVQHQLDQKRSALELQKTEAQAKAQIDELRAQLEHAVEQLQRARKLEESGLAADPTVADLEVQVNRVQREIDAVQRTREFDIASAQLEAQAADQKREYDRALQEYAMVAQARENLMTLSNDIEAITDPSAQIRENDVLMIEVAGEPDLPQEYHVQSDGTIRLPFLPAIKVAGRTTAQAAELIVKQLDEHHLVTKPQVHVKLRRPR